MSEIQTASQNVAITVAQNLTYLLESNRWSGRKAAIALGLTPMYVTRRMSGAVECSASDLAIFAGLLRVPVGAFFAEREEKAPTPQGGGQDVPPTGIEPATFGTNVRRFPTERTRAAGVREYVATVTPITVKAAS